MTSSRLGLTEMSSKITQPARMSEVMMTAQGIQAGSGGNRLELISPTAKPIATITKIERSTKRATGGIGEVAPVRQDQPCLNRRCGDESTRQPGCENF